MFEIRKKFSKFTLKRKIKFAFSPTYVDGGIKKIWFKFYYQMYIRTEGYLNWDMPDKFESAGSYSRNGLMLKYNKLKKENSDYHWDYEDNYIPYYLK